MSEESAADKVPGASPWDQFGPNAPYVEELYRIYCADPARLDPRWLDFFEGINGRLAQAADTPPSRSRAYSCADSEASSLVHAVGECAHRDRAEHLLDAYRDYGHLQADINPLECRKQHLDHPEVFHLELCQTEATCITGCAEFNRTSHCKLAQLKDKLHQIYCGTVGFEISQLYYSSQRQWLIEQIEDSALDRRPAEPDRRELLRSLLQAEVFETELHRRFVASKRFSLQGAETLIPMLEHLLAQAARAGVRQVLMGMAHRGRLNVLCNIMRKPLRELFSEYEDRHVFSVTGAGDVKYHLGYRSHYRDSDDRELSLILSPNPSHLEFVNPVIAGMTRAFQDLAALPESFRALAVMIHGDAALAGQGIVPETLNLSRLRGYGNGGTIHIVINNQIGFTTNPEELHSFTYCTDMARAVRAPVFHVNGDDPEACLYALKLAFDYRQRFGLDAIVDLICYRRYGHNEGDDPSFTQPIMYAEINRKKSAPQLYASRLLQEGAVDQGWIDSFLASYRSDFQKQYEASLANPAGDACPVYGRIKTLSAFTAVERGRLEKVAASLIDFPESFHVHPKVLRILTNRVEAVSQGRPLDFATAEVMAFGSLVLDGVKVRLSGQDSGRGTFSQRHLLLRDVTSDRPFSPFSRLKPDRNSRASFEVFNSPLSEAAVLGFEYGYSLIASDALLIWEAQFGDFSNGAQVLIDQFLCCSEAKWNQLSGLVLLLPHGYEGQGPEHSSARLERFLQLCASGNMSVCYPSSAAQYFHLLRRQGLAQIKRPLVVMTPKSMLRSAEASSELSELTSGRFCPVLAETIGNEGAPALSVLMSGKIFHELKSEIQKHSPRRVNLIRIEELHPYPEQDIIDALKSTAQAPLIWLQEEPENMGAWSYIAPRLRQTSGQELRCISRERSSSSATGSPKKHAEEQRALHRSILDMLK